MSTHLPGTVDASKIIFGDIKTSDMGSKSAYINYGANREQLFVQTPKLSVAFTQSKYGADKDKPIEMLPDVVEKFGLQLSLANTDTNKSVAAFLKQCKEVDNAAIKAGVSNSFKWFKKNHDIEIINEFYSTNVQYTKDKDTGEIVEPPKFPHTFRFNVPVVNGQIKTDCYNTKGEKIDVAFPIERGTIVTAILQVSSVWFMGTNKFGITYRPTSLMVVPPTSNMKKFSFLADPNDNDNEGHDNDGDEEAPRAAPTTTTTTTTTTTKPADEFVESSDDDNDNEPVVEDDTNEEPNDDDDEEPAATATATPSAAPAAAAVEEPAATKPGKVVKRIVKKK